MFERARENLPWSVPTWLSIVLSVSLKTLKKLSLVREPHCTRTRCFRDKPPSCATSVHARVSGQTERVCDQIAMSFCGFCVDSLRRDAAVTLERYR
ncbi:hypothetical protein MTP99_011695 [Tenebrio molitor]|nr:hypothetical protein MTP99_011695 [Tenebrio molitor]